MNAFLTGGKDKFTTPIIIDQHPRTLTLAAYGVMQVIQNQKVLCKVVVWCYAGRIPTRQLVSESYQGDETG